MGCLAAGQLGLYVDRRGRARGCPFGADAGPDVLAEGLDAAIGHLRRAGRAAGPVALPPAPRGAP